MINNVCCKTSAYLLITTFSLEDIWKDFWSFASSSVPNENTISEESEEGSPEKTTLMKASHSSFKLMRKLNSKSDESLLYTDSDEKKLQIVEDDESEKNKIGKINNNSNNETKKNPNLKIGGKFALKFRALIEFDCVQFFIQEADFVFYQYIVDFLIPKVCTYFEIFD